MTFVKNRPASSFAFFALHSRQFQLFLYACQVFAAPIPITTVSVCENVAVPQKEKGRVLTIKPGKMGWFGDDYSMLTAQFTSVPGLKAGALVDMAKT